MLDSNSDDLRNKKCGPDYCHYDASSPKFGVFKGIFPRGSNFGDVDGLVEIGGHGLLLEWKSSERPLAGGQEFTYKNLTRYNNMSVMVVIGDAKTMEVKSMFCFYKGKRSPETGFDEIDLEGVKGRMREWGIWAENNKLWKVSA